jgi:hypothetical protein
MRITALAMAVLFLAGSATGSTNHASDQGLRQLSNPRAVLAPARVPPVKNECLRALLHDADGNVQPVLCPNGGVNVDAWRHYARGWVGHPPLIWSKTMGLGPHPSAKDVFDAMCVDMAKVYGTIPLTESAETLAAAYYGWRFSRGNPSQELGNQPCPGTAGQTTAGC